MKKIVLSVLVSLLLVSVAFAAEAPEKTREPQFNDIPQIRLDAKDKGATIDLTLPRAGFVTITTTVDYWYDEASWNVWSYDASAYYWATDQVFTAGYETTVNTIFLPGGNYSVDCWDSYGDGGIGGNVVDAASTLLVEWLDSDYTSYGYFDFTVAGGVAPNPIEWGAMEDSWYRSPMNVYYKNSIWETVYQQSMLGDACMIYGISFHTDFLSTSTPPFDAQIWMGEVVQGDLSGGWITADYLSLVFDGQIAYDGSDWWTIVFDTPFPYTNIGNLAVMAVRWDTDYYSSSDKFYTTDTGITDVSRHFYSDSTVPDPYTISSDSYQSPTSKAPDVRFYTEPMTGSLDGYVYNTAAKAPIENAEITAGSYVAWTDATGYYEIPEMLSGTYDVTCEATGYNTGTATVDILASTLTTQDFTLTSPTMEVSPLAIDVSLTPGGMTTEYITVANNGDGDLNWNAAILFPDGIGRDWGGILDWGHKEKNTQTSTVDELAPDIREDVQSAHRVAGDVLMTMDVEGPAVDNGIVGCEFDGTNLWFTGRDGSNPNKLHKFDLAGNCLATYDQGTTSTWGMRDMAFDGTYLYAGDDYGFWQIDPATGGATELFHHTFTGVSCIRALAYVPGLGFVCNNWSSDFVIFDAAGNELGTMAGPGVSGYGLAYDEVTDCLWFFSSSGGRVLYQYDYYTESLTGLSYDVNSTFPSGSVGGIFYDYNLIPGKAVIGGVVQTTPDTFFAMELYEYTPWVLVSPKNGTLTPGTFEDVEVTFDAAGIAPDNTLYAGIVFNSDPDVGTETVDVSMEVYIPDGYVIEGFEEKTFPPFGWDNPGGYWERYHEDAFVGQGYARCSWYHDADATLITPRLEIVGGDFINFWWINANLYDSDGPRIVEKDTLFVEISNTYNNTVPVWEEILALSADEEMDAWEQALALIPDTYIGTDAKIRFRHRSNLSAEARGVGLDQILMPGPYLPINFSVDPYYASDYVAAGNSIQYTYDVTNMGVQNDRFIILVQDSASIRYNKRDVEDFEASDGGWVATSDWDPVGDWQWTNTYDVGNYTGSNTPPPTAHSGTGLWGTQVNGDYTNSGGTSYLSKTVDFSDVTDAYLNFWYWSDINGSWDYCDVIVNSDILWTIDTHTPTAWAYTDLDLSAYDGLANVQIVFSFYASTVVERAGMYIDDVDLPGGGGPGPGPTGWPATVNIPYLELDPGETGSFVLTIAIPEDATLDDVQLTPVLVYSREDNAVEHQVLALATCHPKDPYEPNDLMVDATGAHYDFVSDGAQIYYNPDYRDQDIDIYSIDCLEGDIVWCAFELPDDETVFDGAIKLVDADSTELAYADEYAGGGSEYLKYRIQGDGTYYWILGKWNNVLDGKVTKKIPTRGENTTYYVVAFDLIPSPEVDVLPPELTLGMITGTGGTVSDELFISNIAPDAMAEDLNWDIELDIPGVATLFTENFDDPTGWTIEGGTNWGYNNSNYAGGNPPEARFNWNPNTTALQRIISPVINTAGYTSANLTFKHFVNYYNDGVTIGVATTSDGGTTWNTVWSTSPTGDIGPETVPVTIDNADMGSDQFQMCWFFDGISFDIDYWYVDDINLGVGSAWLSASPVAGAIGQGTTQTVTVTCDGDARLDPGTYTADIIVHNDALLYGASDIIVPVTFYISDEAGGLQGTVTFNGEPIDSVMVKAGNFVTYTDEYGYYEFDAIASGFYDILFYKEGFQPYWAFDVYLNPGWTVLLDVELIFDGPVPENLSATGIQEAIDLDWDKPQTGGGGGGTQVEYILDDGSYENGWCINPGYSSWLGNQFPVTDGGEIISFQVYGDVNASAGSETVTIDVFDTDHNYIGSSDPFVIPPGDWETVPAPNIPFAGEFYAMIHWDMLASQTNWFGFDTNGPNANAGYDWYFDGTTWQLLHVVAGSDPGVFMLRTTAMVRGKSVELAYDTYQLGKEPEVYLKPVDNSAFETGQRVLDNAFIQSGQSGDTGNYETSHYTFHGDTELGFRMPKDITLLGYNVYELTKGFVAYVDGENNTSYMDDIVAVGTEYTYWVTAVYEEGESGPSNTDSAIPLAPSGGIYHEPFDVDWSTTGWTTAGSPNNWTWSAGYAYLYWSPSVTNYDMSLISPEILLPDNPLDIYDLTVSMYIDDYSTDTGEIMEIWVIHDGGETMLFEWDLDINDDWGVSGGTDWIYSDLDVYAGQEIQIKFRSHGGDTYNFNYWYVYDVLIDGAIQPPDYGALEGIVTDGDLNPLEGVRVTADDADYNPVYTNDLGYYLIDPMAVGLYNVEYYKDGYSLVEYNDVVIDSGVTTVLDVVLGNPTMDIDPTMINAIVPVGGTTTTTITVTNNGNAPLDWSAAILDMTEYLNEIAELKAHGTPLNANIFPPEMEVSPTGVSYVHPDNRDPWDLQFSWPCAVGNGEAGIETNGNYIYTTNWGYGGNGIFHRYNMDGSYDEQFTIAGIAGGIRDLAYDGEYFYGGTASSTVYVLDLDNEQLVSTFNAPTDIRAIAYNSDVDGFYANNWDTTITLFDRTGAYIDGFACGSYSSYYGFAYDIYSTGGPYLWGFSQDGSGGVIVQIDATTGLETGFTYDVQSDIGAAGDIAGGLFITEGDFDPGTVTIGGLLQNSLLFGYELAPFSTWITIDPTAGTVLPYGASEDVTVYFDAGDDPVGTIHTCDIVFESAQGVPSVTVPVTLMVGTPEYGTLTGTVTAATGGAPIEGAEITASNDADYTYVTYTNSLGEYTIEDMMVGYYTVECTAVGYNYQVVVDVPIVVDQTTTQNFAMLAPIMVVDPTSLNVNVPPGSTLTEYITIYNNGDGPMDFDITLYDYGKALTDYSNCSNGVTISSQNNLPTGPGNSSGFQANGTRDVVIHYDGENDDAIGLTSGGTFMVAARFTSDELGIYYDTYEIIGAELYINDPGSALILKIWEGGSLGNPGSEVYSQDVTGSIVAESWNILDLVTNVPLLAGNEYWLGYEVTHAAQEYPAGCDAGPPVYDKGGWIYFNSAWSQITDYGFLVNWNIRMVIDFGTPPWIVVDPLSGTIPAGGQMDIAVMFDATELTQGEIKTADIEIVPTPDVGTFTVPVVLTATDTVSSGDTPVTETKLYANFPNPMLNTTTFSFSLKDRSHVKLTIYNVKGQLVETLLDNELDPSASHEVEWDGTANGKKLANGIYFYKLETNSKTFLNKMILMK